VEDEVSSRRKRRDYFPGPRPALSARARNDIILAEIKRAEENELKAQIALSMTEEVEDLIPEGEASTLEQKRRDVEGWTRIVRRLRSEYLDEEAEPEDDDDDARG
jgi:hypothetical protein